MRKKPKNKCKQCTWMIGWDTPKTRCEEHQEEYRAAHQALVDKYERAEVEGLVAKLRKQGYEIRRVSDPPFIELEKTDGL